MPIVLRPWRATDAQALQDALQSSPDLRVQFGGADLSTVSLAEGFIEDVLVPAEGRAHWAIDEGGRVLGDVGFSAVEARHGMAWASYWLRSDARGRGLATRSLAAAAERAFAHGLFRLELGHRVNNPASCRVAARAGFLPEGVERQKLRYGDRRFDVELHARLRTDPAPHALEPVELRPR